MPKDRLNLLVERSAVERGKRYSERHGTSVSKLVSDYLAKLPLQDEPVKHELTPTVRRLIGIGKGQADEEDYRKYLLEKYGK